MSAAFIVFVALQLLHSLHSVCCVWIHCICCAKWKTCFGERLTTVHSLIRILCTSGLHVGRIDDPFYNIRKITSTFEVDVWHNNVISMQ